MKEVLRYSWILVAVLVSVSLLVQIPTATAEETGYVKIWTDRDRVDTYAFFTLYIESKVWIVNQSGNSSLVWNNGTVDVTVFAVDDNLTVGRINGWPLVNGRAAISIPVYPEWSDTLVRITVRETVTGMTNVTYIQTEYSMDYLMFLIEKRWFDSFNRFTESTDARVAADDSAKLGAIVSFALAWAFLWVFIFLRKEHDLASGQNHDSLWDRFVHRLFNISLADDETPAWLNIEKTWDRKPAEFYDAARRRSICKKIDSEIETLKDEKLRVQGGEIEVQ